MNRKPGLYASGIILLFMFGVAAWAWPQVPADARIPIHWDLSGTPNGFAGKLQGLLGLPLIAAAVAGLFVLIPSIEPRRRHLSQSGTPYTVTWIGALALMAVLQLAGVLYALGSTRPASLIGLATVGGLFVVIGNYLGKVRSNFMFGIRTPWTLTSEVAGTGPTGWGAVSSSCLELPSSQRHCSGTLLSRPSWSPAARFSLWSSFSSTPTSSGDPTRQSRPSGAEGYPASRTREPARW